jgi:hypothetical protein
MPQRKSVRCDLVHKRLGPARRKHPGMAQKTYPPSFDPPRDLGTDYALIATGVGAALIALIYLVLI